MPTITDHAVPHISTVPANAGSSVELFVREIDGRRPGRPHDPVLMLHGRSAPALAGANLEVPGYNWALTLAEAGLDVFIMDLQGSGRSPRPMMDDPCNANPNQQGALIPNPMTQVCPPTYGSQLTNSQSDWDEVDTVVEFVRARTHARKVALVGWSAAAFQFGPYTVQHPEKVASLLLLAPIFPPNGRQSLPGTRFDAPVPLPVSTPPAQFGYPMSIGTRDNFEVQWCRDLGCVDQRAEGMVDAVWAAMMANDSLGSQWGPLLPNGQPVGVLRIRNSFFWGWNSSTVPLDGTLGDRVPVLILYGEHDTQANTPTPAGPLLTFSVPALYDAIPGAAKLMFRVACSGHFMVWDRGATLLHQFSTQWLTDAAVQGLTSGSYLVDTDGTITPA